MQKKTKKNPTKQKTKHRRQALQEILALLAFCGTVHNSQDVTTT